MSIFKRKSFYIIIVIILLVIVGVAYGKYRQANKPVEYETAEVKRGDVTRTVEATGKVQSATDLSLRFETAGTVALVKVNEGGKVKSGDLIASLNLSALNAAVAEAEANLKQKLAGSTTEELNSLKAAVDSAQAALNKAKADGLASVAAAEASLETAKANLKLAEGGDESKIVTNAYDSTVALLQKTLYVLTDALTQADNILGIDNTIANDDFEKYLSTKDNNKISLANQYYLVAKDSKTKANNLVLPLTTASNHSDVDKALVQTETALSDMNKLLAAVSDTLEATVPVGTLTQTSLDAKKTIIASSRSLVTTQYTSLISQKQTIIDAKNSYTTYKIAYDKAVKDLSNTKDSVNSNTSSLAAAFDQAKANYQNKLNPPREVDVAYYRAALAQAAANRDKAILLAPMDGVITKVNKKKGEYVAAAEVMTQMVSPHYEIEVDVPETDIAKVVLNNEVSYTLDAFGDNYKFKGKVFSLDPKSTEIQDVVYYKIKITINDSDIKNNSVGKEIKPGMTANVTINTDAQGLFKNVIHLPTRAVLTAADGSKYVRVLKSDSEITTTTVQLGSRVDNGQVVISSGLRGGEKVVLSVKK